MHCGWHVGNPNVKVLHQLWKSSLWRQVCNDVFVQSLEIKWCKPCHSATVHWYLATKRVGRRHKTPKMQWPFHLKILIFSLTVKQNRAQKHLLVPVLLGCIRQDIASRLGEVILPLCSDLVRHMWVLCPELGSPVWERHGDTGDHKDD